MVRVWWGNTAVPPSDPQDAILFQNALLLVVFGSALLEPYFTRPAEGLVNAFTALVTDRDQPDSASSDVATCRRFPGAGAGNFVVAAVWCRAFGRAQKRPIAVPQLARKGG